MKSALKGAFLFLAYGYTYLISWYEENNFNNIILRSFFLILLV